ncbi:MAG: hypothetical protein Q8L48_38165 [Archangium sp.]|nr:hypothetical protein [Archangium sp.]
MSDEAKERRRKQGLFPSRDVDVKTALELFGWNAYRFARSTEALPAATITRILAALVRTKKKDPSVLFLQAAFDPAAPETSWRAAVGALKNFESDYAWGSAPKRQRLTAIAQDPRLLAATQLATVGAERVRDEYLAVLVIDGSETSLDALLPHFSRAMKDPARLDALQKVARFARDTPALGEMFSQVNAGLEGRKSASAALALAGELGISSGDRFRVRIDVKGLPPGKTSCGIVIDSAAGDELRVAVLTGFGADAMTRFTGAKMLQDDLKLGRCELAALPAWLARAAKKLRVRWDRGGVTTGHLRGKRLEVFLSWLFAKSS